MNKIVSILVFCVFLPSNALADSSISLSEYDWNGFYAGFTAGAVTSSLQTSYDVKLTGFNPEINNGYRKLETTDTAQSQMLGAGVVIGYNWQNDFLLIGMEADQSFSNTGVISRSEVNTFRSLSNYRDMSHSVGQAKILYNLDWTGTVRGRIGLAAQNLMIYGTGGVAYGHINGSATVTANWYDEEVSDSTTREGVNVGWVVGSGIEYGAEKFSVGVEFAYLQFRPVYFNWKAFDGVVGKKRNVEVSGTIDNPIGIFRTMLKWHF